MSTKEVHSKAQPLVFPIGTSSLRVVFQRPGIVADARDSTPALFIPRGAAAFFRTFADVEPTSEGIAKFHEAFGLTDFQRASCVIDGDTGIIMMEGRPSRSAPDWKQEILALRRCISLWDMIQTEDQAKLHQYVRWERDVTNGLSVIYDSHPDMHSQELPPPPDVRTRDVILSEADQPELIRRFYAGDTVRPGMLYLSRIINQRLTDHVRVQMLLTGGGIGLHLIPNQLLAAVWLQFAEAVAENKRHERCRACNSWFEVARDGSHKDRRYCSDACKVDVYRKRKKEAIRLASEGMKARDIAREVGSDTDTVKGWIGKR